MALGNPIEAYLQAAQQQEQNRRQSIQDMAGIGQNIGQIGQQIGGAVAAYKKKQLLDQLVMAMQNNGQPQAGPQPQGVGAGAGMTPPTSGMGAPAQDNSALIQSLMIQYDPETAVKEQLKQSSASPWTVVPSMLVDGKPVQENKRTGLLRPGAFAVTPTGRGNSGFGAGSVDWNSATDQDKEVAKALYEGRVRPFDLSYRDRGTGVKLANQYALLNGLPAYKSYTGDVSAGTAKAFAFGKPGNNTLALNTALGHLDTANDAFEAVKNTNVEFLNEPINTIRKKTNDPNIVRLVTALNAVRGEAANVFKSNGATDQEIESWRESINENLTPAQAQGTIQMLDELFRSRLKALEYMRQNGLGGRAEGTLLSPKASEISKKLGDSKAPTKQKGGLTPQERAELQRLEMKYGAK